MEVAVKELPNIPALCCSAQVCFTCYSELRAVLLGVGCGCGLPCAALSTVFQHRFFFTAEFCVVVA